MFPAKPLLLLSFCAFLVYGESALADKGQPILAVFDVQTKGLELESDFMDRLADYLTTGLTATGSFRVVPREQIRKRLLAEKKKTYKECYDQSCQIELGRELAAEKTMSTRIMKLGSRCTVALTLFDLTTATTDRAAQQSGACSQDDLIGLLDKAISELVGSQTGDRAIKPNPAPKADTSTPKENAAPEPPEPKAVADMRDPADNVWLAARLGGGIYGIGLDVDVFVLRWQNLYLNLLTLSGGGFESNSLQDYWFWLGSTAGYPIHLLNNSLEIRFGAGLGFHTQVKDNVNDWGVITAADDGTMVEDGFIGLGAAIEIGLEYRFSERLGLSFNFRQFLPFVGQIDWKDISGGGQASVNKQISVFRYNSPPAFIIGMGITYD